MLPTGSGALIGAAFVSGDGVAFRGVLSNVERHPKMRLIHSSNLRSPTDSTVAMRDYGGIVSQIKKRYGIRVKRWRTNMTGCAWQVRYRDGRVIRWIESPRPKSPISLAIFLHEVGHHVIGFEAYKRRCEEEYHAWRWAIETMRELGVEPDQRVLQRFELSMAYAVDKALRRGIKDLPEILTQFAAKAA